MEKEELLKVLEINERIVRKVWDEITNNKHFVYLELIQDANLIKNTNSNNLINYGWKTKTVRDKILLDYPTYIKIKYPVFQRKDNGATLNYADRIVEPKQKISKHLIKKVLQLLKRITATYTQVATLTDLSIQEIQNIFDKYVSCSRGKLTKILCLDECHNKNQFGDDKYSAVISDFILHNIIDVVKNRKLKTLTEYFSAISLKERLNVEFVCMDMWEPYKQIVTKYLPNATIVIDKFHVLQVIKSCIKNIEMEIYYSYPENSKERKLLKKYFNQTIDYKINHQKISFEIEKGTRLTTYEVKHKIMLLNKKLADAIKFLDAYIKFCFTCPIEEFDKGFEQLIKENPIYFDNCFTSIRTMFNDWYDEIKNSFQTIEINNLTHELVKMSNGLAESLNNLYKDLMRISNGVKDFERFRKRLMYCVNKFINYITNL